MRFLTIESMMMPAVLCGVAALTGGCGSSSGGGSAPLVMVVNTALGSYSDPSYPTQFTIRTQGSGYDYSIGCGNGQSTVEHVEGDYTCNYPNAGTFEITISGSFPRMYFSGDSRTNTDKLVSVEQWGSIAWQSMAGAFAGCRDLEINAADAPDLSQVTDMSHMFEGCLSLTDRSLSHWDVSHVTNMRSLFDTSTFNGDVGAWNTGSVTDMSYMFSNAGTFSGHDLSQWDVSNVTVHTGFDNNWGTGNTPPDWVY